MCNLGNMLANENTINIRWLLYYFYLLIVLFLFLNVSLIGGVTAYLLIGVLFSHKIDNNVQWHPLNSTFKTVAICKIMIIVGWLTYIPRLYAYSLIRSI
jgi:hypothetical protein